MTPPLAAASLWLFRKQGSRLELVYVMRRPPACVQTHFGASSPHLFLSSAMGSHFDTATVAVYQVNNAGVATPYLTITLSTVFVESEAFAGAASTPPRADTVNVSLAFGTIKLTDINTGATVCRSQLTNAAC